MNIFFIPSWYPSPNQPLPGIFFREQAIALARNYPSQVRVGISTWGQNDDRYLLWAGEPVKSIGKIFKTKAVSTQKQVDPFGFVEYHTPTFTWTDKIAHGNIQGIIRANERNLQAFAKDAGDIDIIHAHVGYPAGYIAKKLSEIHGIPYLITEQMSPFPHKYFIAREGKLKTKLREAYAHSACNIAISGSLADKMNTKGIERIRVVPNLIDEQFFIPLHSSRPRQTPVFFTLGRMVSQKGIDILLKALARCTQNLQLRIGGDGPLLHKYDRLAKNLGIENKVQWLGPLDKHAALLEYQQCDAFVLASRHESMGVVFAEAMACGKPVIGSVCGGPEEFITEQTGLLIPANDISALAKALEKMSKIHDQYPAKDIRAACLSQFSAGVISKKLMDIYEQILTIQAS